MLGNIVVILVAIVAGVVIFSRRLEKAKAWKATVTPLASIIGSGFLVSVPLLADEVGNFAIVAMALLVGASYLVGAVIRFNIRYAEPFHATKQKGVGVHVAHSLEHLSSIVLAFAYFISVAYYLVLLGNFLLNGLGVTSPTLGNVIATVILAALGSLGFFKGLGVVERVEKYTVGINLTVIVALLGGLLAWNGKAVVDGTWHLSTDQPKFSTETLRALLGLLIVVQGFETSRYLGDDFDGPTRIRTMRYAQWIAAAVYIAFFALMTSLFTYLPKGGDITAVISLVGHAAVILPIMLTIGAVASQFSASVADSVGCAGLLEDVAAKRLSVRHAYPLIAIISITILWNANIYRIITLASQAFAMFYLVQCGVAVAVAYETRDLKRRALHMAFCAAVGVLCLCVVIFGVPSGS